MSEKPNITEIRIADRYEDDSGDRRAVAVEWKPGEDPYLVIEHTGDSLRMELTLEEVIWLVDALQKIREEML